MNIEKTGNFIKERRTLLGLSQDELGRLLNVTGQAVSKWERGLSCPDITLISVLSDVLKVGVTEILNGEKSDPSKSSLIVGETAPQCDCTMETDEEFTVGHSTAQTVSPYLFGTNIEHSRACIFHGLSAELLQNRKFAGKPSCPTGHADGWFPIGEDAYFTFEAPYTRHSDRGYHMTRTLECNSQRVASLTSGRCGIGQHGLDLYANTEYVFTLAAKAKRPLCVAVSVVSADGKTVYSENSLTVSSCEWQEYTLTFTMPERASGADLQITFDGQNALWLGAVSLMPGNHFHGMRRDVIDALREMGIRVLRWPGGNFAGEYCWFDGLLPRNVRAPLQSYLGLETQPYTMGFDFHEINTDDFIALCREIGAEPYITVNLAWNTPEENAAWVEYCNGDETTEYGKIRAERGFPQPYNVKLWSLGNEAGYGHMEGPNMPYAYFKAAEKSAIAMKKVSPYITMCSSGLYPGLEWAEQSGKPLALANLAPLVSFHHYAPAPDFAADDLKAEYNLLFAKIEEYRKRLEETHRHLGSRVMISFDEWGSWYAWHRPSSVYDGIFTALMLHLLVKEADAYGIRLSCQFEAVNEGLMHVSGDSVELTASGQVFSMMKHHCGAKICCLSDTTLMTRRKNTVTLTSVNASFDRPKRVAVTGAGAVSRAVVYYGETVLPRSYFKKVTVSPVEKNGSLIFEVPPHSILYAVFS